MSVDEIMKMYEQGGTKNKEKLVEMLHKKIDDCLDKGFHQGMSHGTLYETLYKEKAILEMHSSGNTDKSTAYLVESSGVSARQLFCSRVNESKLPKIDKNVPVVEQVPENFDKSLINFSKDPLEFRQRLQELPTDCIIVQISEIYPGQRQFPPEVKTKPLCVTRFGCGENFMDTSVQNIAHPHPLPAARNADIIQELKAIIKENVDLVAGSRRLNYKQQKLMLEERFQVVLEAVQDWLGPWRCLLLGHILDEKIRSAWDKLIRKLAKELKIANENVTKLSLLAQCSNVLKKVDLVQGLEEITPQSVKNKVDFVSKAVKLVKEHAQEVFGSGIAKLKEVERHPVILIIDKGIFWIPWEQLDILQSHPMSRMPCLALTHALFKAPRTQRQLDSRSTYFVVDPDKNLPRTANRLKPVFEARDEWTGTIGEPPEQTQMQKQLQENDIYIYCGHGSGSHLAQNYNSMQLNTAAMLMGCSSADLHRYGVHWEMYGAPLNFLLGGSPIALGMLWTVTDSDADKMTVRLLETWLPPKGKDTKYRLELCSQDISFAKVFEDLMPQKGLLRALRSAQSAATSKIMSSAFIAVGIPVYVKHASK